MNGWKNYETWNVALWIQNDRSLYKSASLYGDFEIWRDDHRLLDSIAKTPDGVSYFDKALDIAALQSMFREIYYSEIA
ncbi:MAG: hypothetical protein EBY38_07355 [Flavobacteriaceae bacterium]|nr:hypothetical protein [Flavobacteriaceae bacterium]